MSENVSSFVNKLADILLRLGKQRDQCIESELVYFRATISFEIIILWQYINSFEDRDNITTRNTTELIKEDVLPSILARGSIGRRADCGTLYVKDAIELL